jgi:hypothetical protein
MNLAQRVAMSPIGIAIDLRGVPGSATGLPVATGWLMRHATAPAGA